MSNIKVEDNTDIDAAYDKRLRSAEHSGSDASYVSSGIDQLEALANDPASHVRDGEKDSTPTPGWANHTGESPVGTPSVGGAKKAMNIAKKGGPFGLIIGLLIGGAGMVSLVGGPGLLIVNFAEILTQKFNYQLGVMDSRNTRIIQSKLDNTTKGLCTSVTSKLCKFSTFSDTEIAKFEKAGLKVNKTGTAISGRNIISSFEMIDGTAVDAANYKGAMKNMPEFKNAMKRAYNMKYLGTSDSIFTRVLEAYKAKKTSPLPDDAATDDERTAALSDSVKDGTDANLSANACKDPKNCTDQENTDSKARSTAAGEVVGDATSNNDSVANRVLNEVSDVVDGTSTDMTDIANKVSSAAGTSWKLGANAISITGQIDNACMAYGWVKAFSITAKVVRSAQLVRLAMPFLTASSMIKAGTAKAADISYFATMITKIVTINGKKTKAGTDSLGYRYAAFGDTGMTASGTNAVVGATFPATIQTALDTLTGVLGSRSGADKTCRFLANPIVQGASLLVGIASFFVGVGEVNLSFKAVTIPLLLIVAGFLPPMLGEILSGKVVTSSTFGEVLGDLITSGTSSLLSKSSSQGGSAILKRSQAVLYMQHQDSVIADYADYERSTHSAFDASNPNTFLGSIYTRFAPYFTQTTSVTGALSTIGSVLTSSVSNVVSPKASAASYDYSDCKDAVVEDLDMATDPFCNPVTGIPTEYLNEDPVTVFNHLQASGAIDSEGNPLSDKYKDFLSKCVTRENPFGTSNADEEDGSNTCFIDSQDKAEWYIYQVDSRVIDVRENETAASEPVGTEPTGSCATGTNIVSGIGTGIAEGGTEKAITLCAVPITSGQINPGWTNKKYQGTSSKGIADIVVNNEATQGLLDAATKYKKETGKTLSASVGYRSVYEQCSFFMNGKNTPSVNQRQYYDKYCKPNTSWLKYPTGDWTTPVVISNHMMGYSIDFTGASESWMRKCVHDTTDGKSDNRCYGFYDDVYQKQKWDSGHFTFSPT